MLHAEYRLDTVVFKLQFLDALCIYRQATLIYTYFTHVILLLFGVPSACLSLSPSYPFHAHIAFAPELRFFLCVLPASPRLWLGILEVQDFPRCQQPA